MKSRRSIRVALVVAFATGCAGEEEETGAVAVEESGRAAAGEPSPLDSALAAAVDEFFKQPSVTIPGGWVGFTRGWDYRYDERSERWVPHELPPEVAAAWGRVAKEKGTVDERAGVEWIPIDPNALGFGVSRVRGLPQDTRVVTLSGFKKLEGEDRYEIFLSTTFAPLGEIGTMRGGMTVQYDCKRDASGRWTADIVGGMIS